MTEAKRGHLHLRLRWRTSAMCPNRSMLSATLVTFTCHRSDIPRYSSSSMRDKHDTVGVVPA